MTVLFTNLSMTGFENEISVNTSEKSSDTADTFYRRIENVFLLSLKWKIFLFFHFFIVQSGCK